MWIIMLIAAADRKCNAVVVAAAAAAHNDVDDADGHDAKDDKDFGLQLNEHAHTAHNTTCRTRSLSRFFTLASNNNKQHHENLLKTEKNPNLA